MDTANWRTQPLGSYQTVDGRGQYLILRHCDGQAIAIKLSRVGPARVRRLFAGDYAALNALEGPGSHPAGDLITVCASRGSIGGSEASRLGFLDLPGGRLRVRPGAAARLA